MMSDVSSPLTWRCRGAPDDRKPDFRSMTGTPGGRDVVLVQEALLDHDGLGPAADDDVAGLVGFEPCVHRDQHRACSHDPERGDHPFGAVGRPDRDPIALFDAEIREGACRATNPIDDLGEGESQRTVDNRFRVAEAVRRAQDHLGDGLEGMGTRHTVTRRPRLPPMIFA